MSQNFVRCTLVDAVANAERLPRLPERMEAHHAAQTIRVWDACLL